MIDLVIAGLIGFIIGAMWGIIAASVVIIAKDEEDERGDRDE